MNKEEWLLKIQEKDPKAKFVRINDPIIGTHQETGKLQIEMVYSRGDNRGKYYYCKCDCGNYTTTWGSHFRTNHTKSCGCYMVEHGQKHMQQLINNNKHYSGYDLSGQIINNFKIIRKIDQNNNKEWIYECICPKCNNICYKTKKSIEKSISCGCIRNFKGEEKIIEILNQNNISYIRQKTFQDCRYNQPLQFDFYINNNYLIEYDGIQHFKATGGWFNENDVKKIK